MSSGISVGTYSGGGDDGPTAGYRATVEGPGAGMAGVHGSSASYGPGTGSAYYPFGTGTARSFPESDGMTGQTSQRHQDTGAGHQSSSCSVMDAPARRHLVSARYAGGCDDNLSCGGVYHPCGQQQQHARMMAATGDPNFLCSVWTPENGYASYVIDPRSGATIASRYPDSPPDSSSEPYSPPNGGTSSSLDPRNTAGDVQRNGEMSKSAVPSTYAYQNRTSQHQPPMLPSQSPFIARHHHPQHSGSCAGLPPSAAVPPHFHYAPVHHHPQQGLYVGGGQSAGARCASRQCDVTSMPPPTAPSTSGDNMAELNPFQLMASTSYTHSVQPNKKRKISDVDSLSGSLGRSFAPPPPPGVDAAALHAIKHEPVYSDASFGLSVDGGDDDLDLVMDTTCQVIKWTSHQPSQWAALVDDTGHELPVIGYRVDADKGFNFSLQDDSFVCQKKNHFQVTMHVTVEGSPKFVKLADGNAAQIHGFYVNFHGIKMESPTQTIKIEQSQSDRSKIPYYPVRVDIRSGSQVKLTVGRLHFSETTSNNMRKKGKPNPDQRFFQLVVSLTARYGSEGGERMIAAHVSEPIIVRASNPGQFDNESDAPWNKGPSQDTVYHMGNVGINTESPDEALTVVGNVKLTGHVFAPSDARVKTDVLEVDTREQLQNITQLRVVNYRYDDQFADAAGLPVDQRIDTGVLAQELHHVLPDAVLETGDVILPSGETIPNLLVVNKERIFIENVGAVKELCKVTDKLETRINMIETLNQKLRLTSSSSTSIYRCHSDRSTCSTRSSTSNFSTPRPEDKNKAKPTPNSASDVSEGDRRQRRRDQCPRCGHHHSHHHHQHHHHRGDRYSRSGTSCEHCDDCSVDNNAGVCSNRMVQIAVIVLVLIMAICLFSITGLYVAETVNDSGVDDSQYVGASLSNDSDASHTPPTTVSRPEQYTGPGGDTGIRPIRQLLPYQCYSRWSQCPLIECKCALQQDDFHPPQKSPNSVDNGAVNSVTKPTKPKWKESNSVADKLNSGGHGPRPQMTSHVHLSVNNINNGSPMILRRPSENASLSNNIDNMASVERLSRRRRHVEDSASDMWQVPVSSVKLVQLNRSITDDYCVNPDCSGSQGAELSADYLLPLHPHFPLEFVKIQFELTSSNASVTLCHDQVSDYCPSPSQVVSTANTTIVINASKAKSSRWAWDIPIGFYMKTSYRFVVAMQTGRCTPGSAMDPAFTYNFTFQRQCE